MLILNVTLFLVIAVCVIPKVTIIYDTNEYTHNAILPRNELNLVVNHLPELMAYLQEVWNLSNNQMLKIRYYLAVAQCLDRLEDDFLEWSFDYFESKENRLIFRSMKDNARIARDLLVSTKLCKISQDDEKVKQWTTSLMHMENVHEKTSRARILRERKEGKALEKTK